LCFWSERVNKICLFAVPHICLGYLYESPAHRLTGHTASCQLDQPLTAVHGACGAVTPGTTTPTLTALMGQLIMNVCAPDMANAQCACCECVFRTFLLV
jgi:hypothetical protein